MSARTSLVVAGILVAIGAVRFTTDTLHELDPDYWRAVDGTWLRYLIRAPSDGTWAGRLNAQWFKLLAIPAGISLIYLRSRFGSGTAEAREAEFKDWGVRGLWIAMFFLGFTFLELQKQFGGLVLVDGENAIVNHVVHVLSALLAWRLSSAFTIAPAASSPPFGE